MALLRIRKAKRSVPDSGERIFLPAEPKGIRATVGKWLGYGHRRADLHADPVMDPEQDCSLTDSDNQIDSRERVALMGLARGGFEDIPHIKHATRLEGRFTTPVSWESTVCDEDVALRLTKFIAQQMEADQFDFSEAADLPTMIRAARHGESIDGDIFLNAVTPRGEQYSRIEPIRAHRVGSEEAGFFDVSSELQEKLGIRDTNKKFREHSGVVLDQRNRRRFIRVSKLKRNQEVNLLSSKDSKLIPFRQIFQIYDPAFTDRVREVTVWNTALRPMRHCRQIWDALRVTLQGQVSSPFVYQNETGKAPSRRSNIEGGNEARRKTAVEKSTGKRPVAMSPGQIQYLPLNHQIVDFKAQRPNASFFDCMRHIYECGALAQDLPYPMTVNSREYGGASLRYEIDQGRASIGNTRTRMTRQFLKGWVRMKIAEGIRAGDLPYRMSQLDELSVGEWYWPTMPVADEKYSNDVTQKLYSQGFCSGSDITKPKGRPLKSVQQERGKELKSAIAVAKEVHAEHPDIPLLACLDRVQAGPNPNGSAVWKNDTGQASGAPSSAPGSEAVEAQAERFEEAVEESRAVTERLEATADKLNPNRTCGKGGLTGTALI
ncbi:MAG: phage portal protein [Verrucomicrobiota bacterium]